MSVELVIFVLVGAYVLGWLEGPRFWAWLKSWIVKEVKSIGPSGATTTGGPTGATGA